MYRIQVGGGLRGNKNAMKPKVCFTFYNHKVHIQTPWSVGFGR